MSSVELRLAVLGDVPELQALIAGSCRALASSDYTAEQIEAAIGTAWGVDTELIRDGTYFAAQIDGELVGCGGWSKRRTLFGADGQQGRNSASLIPGQDAAKVRAFFVRPEWARHGVGRALLDRCEAEARKAGFDRIELLATLPGARLYKSSGYAGDVRVPHTLPGGIVIDFVPMQKRLP